MKFSLIKEQSEPQRLRLDGEMGHACFRFFGTLAFVAYLAVAHAVGHLANSSAVVIGVGAYLAFGLLWIGVVASSVLTFKVRRVLSIVLDQAMFAVALGYAGEAMGPVTWAPVVMVIGNALRNGPYYARLSAVSGVACSATAICLSPFWRSIPLTSEGVILAIIVLPVYVQVLSEQVAHAKRELKLRAAKFEFASKTDSLTGILNRSGFFYALEELLEEVRNKPIKGAIMLLDLDGFKAVNDECGHSAGDAALKEIAARLMQCVRVADTVARIGGDEFGIALANVSTDESVERVARDVIASISALRMPARPELRLGVSIGICLLPDPRFSAAEEIMDEADRLMYQAKRAGTNQFRVSSERDSSDASEAA